MQGPDKLTLFSSACTLVEEPGVGPVWAELAKDIVAFGSKLNFSSLGDLKPGRIEHYQVTRWRRPGECSTLFLIKSSSVLIKSVASDSGCFLLADFWMEPELFGQVEVLDKSTPPQFKFKVRHSTRGDMPPGTILH